MNRHVLITGAAGFIGSRLAQRLTLESRASVTGYVHRSTGGKLARLARFPVDIVSGDVRNQSRLDEVATDCDVVIHCAMGDAQTNIDGTRNALEAADRHDLNAVIHLSSYVVHGRDPDADILDESTPFDPDADAYSRSKKRAEDVVWEYYEQRGVPVIVFRPAIVYGPHGSWTGLPIRHVQQGAKLVGSGTGLANIIYVDNLVDAILQALDTEAAIGEAFLATDDDTLTWHEYYKAYTDIIDDAPPVEGISKTKLRLRRKKWLVLNSTLPPLRVLKYAANRAFSETTSTDVQRVAFDEMKRVPWARYLFEHTPDRWQRKLLNAASGSASEMPSNGDADEDQSEAPPTGHLPNDEESLLHTASVRVQNDKLKRILGWEQRVSFDEAMALIEAWMRYERII